MHNLILFQSYNSAGRNCPQSSQQFFNFSLTRPALAKLSCLGKSRRRHLSESSNELSNWMASNRLRAKSKANTVLFLIKFAYFSCFASFRFTPAASTEPKSSSSLKTTEDFPAQHPIFDCVHPIDDTSTPPRAVSPAGKSGKLHSLTRRFLPANHPGQFRCRCWRPGRRKVKWQQKKKNVFFFHYHLFKIKLGGTRARHRRPGATGLLEPRRKGMRYCTARRQGRCFAQFWRRA